MSSDALGALCIRAIGGGWGQEVQDEKHTERVAVIRGTDIPRASFGNLEGIPFRWETPSKVKSRLLQAGDIVLEISGGSAASGQHTGRALFVTSDLLDRLGGHVIPASFCRLLRLDSRKVDPKYICYQIAGMHLTGEISEFENQSTGIANFQFARFISDVSPALDALHDQREVAAVLGALDDRITLLRETNETLEAIAQALFKSWFVDFDPVRAKAEGRLPDGVDAATAALFPDVFDESELGLVPSGWKVSPIYEIAAVTYGAPFASKLFKANPPGLPLVRIRDLKDERPGVYTEEVHPKGYLIQPGDIVVGMDGEFRSYVWGGEEAWLNQRVCVFAPVNGACAAFVRLSITPLLAAVEASETATTVIHLGKNDIDRFKIICPTPKILKSFGEIVNPIYSRFVKNKQQIQTLSNLRDTLLPRLISGQLRISDAEAELEMAIA